MLTRCPVCGTTFRVTPEQLKARSGRVRCGECRHAFNALETLAEEPPPALAEQSAAPPAEETATTRPAEEIAAASPPEDTAAAPPAEEPVAETTPAPAPENTELSAPAAEEHVALPEPAAIEAVAPIDTAAPEPMPEPEPEAELAPEAALPMPSEPAAQVDAAAEPSAEQAGAETGTLEQPAVPEPEDEDHEPYAWPWAVGIGVALFVLMVQALLHYRTEIAVLYPEARPMFEAMCDTFNCELSRPRKPELVGIESSDLSVADAHLSLTATIKNRAPFAQEYPHLEVTLTDTADKALVRRVLAPQEYLPPQTKPAEGFGARAEIAVSLVIAAPGIPAAGYRLYLFYP